MMYKNEFIRQVKTQCPDLLKPFVEIGVEVADELLQYHGQYQVNDIGKAIEFIGRLTEKSGLINLKKESVLKGETGSDDRGPYETSFNKRVQSLLFTRKALQAKGYKKNDRIPLSAYEEVAREYEAETGISISGSVYRQQCYYARRNSTVDGTVEFILARDSIQPNVSLESDVSGSQYSTAEFSEIKPENKEGGAS